ncbi:hypothetical protein LINPERPRIM_LOCUS39398 [Linum perenne]
MMFRVQSRLPQLFIQRPCVTSTSKSQSLAATVAPLVLSVPSLLAMVRTQLHLHACMCIQILRNLYKHN